MSSTLFNVSVAFDKASYNAGETITMTLTGDATFVSDQTTTTSTGGPLNITAVADNGATTQISSPTFTVVTTNPPTTTTLNVKLSTIAGDSRTWTIAPNGKTATAVA